MSHFKNIFKREVRQILTKPIYIVASVVALTFSYVFFLTLMDEGVPQKLPIAIIDNDDSEISRRFLRELNSTQGVEVVRVLTSEQEAREMMQRGKIYAFLDVPRNFYSDLLGYKRPTVAFYVNEAYLVGGTLSYKQLMFMVNLASAAFQREMLRAKGVNDDKIMDLIQPVVADVHMLGNPWSNYSVYLSTTILPGILGMIVALLTVYSIGSELKMRKGREYMDMAGGSIFTALSGKLLPFTILFTILGLMGNVVLFKFMHYPMNGSFWFLLFGTVVYVISMQFVGIAMIGALPVLRDGICLAALYTVLAFSLSGFTYPVCGMYSFIQGLSVLFPLRHYYMLYVNEALFGMSPIKSFVQIAAMMGFIIFPIVAAKRLKNALINMNYPLK